MALAAPGAAGVVSIAPQLMFFPVAPFRCQIAL
jgi:hypothetical protein